MYDDYFTKKTAYNFEQVVFEYLKMFEKRQKWTRSDKQHDATFRFNALYIV
mgnify:CR=1 FL=1